MSRTTVVVQWTNAARESLRKLPKKVAAGLVRKAGELTKSDPRKAGKPLTDELGGCYRISHGRHRAIYQVVDVKDEEGGAVALVRVIFIIAGVRKEGDRGDVYREALRPIQAGGLNLDEPHSPPRPTARATCRGAQSDAFPLAADPWCAKEFVTLAYVPRRRGEVGRHLFEVVLGNLLRRQ